MVLSSCEKPTCITTIISSKNNGDCFCIYCLHSFRTESKLKSQLGCVCFMQVFANICRYIQIPNRHQKNHIDLINSHRSDKIVHKKNKQWYGVWLFITHSLFICQQEKPNWFLQRWGLYKEVLCKSKRARKYLTDVINCERIEILLLTKKEKKSFKK